MIAVLWRELKVSFGNIFSLVAQFIVPLFLLVLFATTLAGNISKITIGNIQVNYIQFFTPGLFGYVTFLILAMSFSFIRIDRQTGMLSIIALSPTSLKGYYWGKLIMQIVMTILKVAFLALIAFLISSKTPAFDLAQSLLFILVLILGVTIWFSLGLTGGIFIQRDDLREVIMMLVTLPLTFASSMYYNVELAPKAIRWIATINPLTYICNLLRGCYLGILPNDYTIQLAILFGFALVFMLIAFYALKRVRF